jgi:hypothetical protein
MKPFKMLCDHNPINGEYGDCLRTVIASLLDLGPIAVPHFAEDGADAQTVWKRCNDWLETQGFQTFFMFYTGEYSLDDVMKTVAAVNPNLYYMICGRGHGGDHIVIALNDEIVHDPSRFGVGLSGPGSTGYWQIVTLVSSRMMAI